VVFRGALDASAKWDLLRLDVSGNVEACCFVFSPDWIEQETWERNVPFNLSDWEIEGRATSL